MARKKKTERRHRHFIEFEKKLIDFAEKKIHLDTAVKNKWQTIEPILQKWIKNRNSYYSIELANFMGSSSIQVIVYTAHKIPKGADQRHYKLLSDLWDLTEDEALKILYVKKKRNFFWCHKA